MSRGGAAAPDIACPPHPGPRSPLAMSKALTKVLTPGKCLCIAHTLR